jgi:hypothetical protein
MERKETLSGGYGCLFRMSAMIAGVNRGIEPPADPSIGMFTDAYKVYFQIADVTS